MPALSVRRYSDLVRRLLALKGQDALVSIDTILLAGIMVEMESAHPEWDFIEDTNRFSSGLQTTATPAGGLFSAVELRNPASSNRLVIVDDVYLENGGVASYDLGIDAGALSGGVGKGIALDSRFVGNSAAELRVTATAGAQVVTDGSAIDENLIGASEESTPFRMLPVILGPNHRLTVACRTAAVLTQCIFRWHERYAELTELPG